MSKEEVDLAIEGCKEAQKEWNLTNVFERAEILYKAADILEENIDELIKLCSKVLSDNPLFFLINSYTTGISAKVLENLLSLNIKKKGKLLLIFWQ